MIEYLFPTPLFDGLRITRLIPTCHNSATVTYYAGDGQYLEETILPEQTAGSVQIGYGPRSRVMVVFQRSAK